MDLKPDYLAVSTSSARHLRAMTAASNNSRNQLELLEQSGRQRPIKLRTGEMTLSGRLGIVGADDGL